MTRIGSAAVSVLAAAALGGCAISKELQLESDGAGLPSGSAVSMAMVAPDGTPAADFAASLADALAARGHAIRDDAPFVAVSAFTRRSAATGTADAAPPPAGSNGDIAWISAPRRRGMFQSCAGERLRGTLALYSRADGSLVYRGSGEMDGCDFEDSDIAALASGLVGAAAR